MIPTRPWVSRNAMRSSPSIRSRTGAPSGSMISVESRAGNQKLLNTFPIGVPGPVRTRISASEYSDSTDSTVVSVIVFPLEAASSIVGSGMADKDATLKHRVSMMETPSNVRDLLAFSVTVDLKSLTGAAKNLGESKGSISRRLTRLEKQLGVNLVRRSARGIQPTEAGELYHPFVKRALTMLGEASAVVHPPGELAGVLRISVSHGFGLQVLGPIIGRFASVHRALRLHVALNNAPQLDDAETDIAIHPGRQVPNLSVARVELI